MSKSKHIIEIEPPEYAEVREKRIFRGFQCPQCHGQGNCLNTADPYHPTYTSCPHCDGTGKVKAEVTINWVPDYD